MVIDADGGRIVTFPLTNAGRDNLEAILAEFERAGRFYPPLYHERLIACSETGGGVHLSETEWQAFIEAQSNEVDEGEWSQWDGPYWASPDYFATCLGRWSGHPDGLQEFINLSNSVTEVLKREDFSSVDDRYLRFSFRSWREWLSTIHSWAFQFQMPLLSSDMTLWGAEEYDQDDFYELAEQMSQTGDVEWPLHPIRWSLIYNVFTSSAAAIRAILRPQTVIGVNEPWPSSERISMPLPPEAVDVIPPQICHRIVRDPVGWHVVFADDPSPVICAHASGIHIISLLLQWSGQELDASQLCQYGTRSRHSSSISRTKEDFDDGDGITFGKKPLSKQYQDDEDARRRTEQLLNGLLQERAEALRDNDVAAKLIIADIDEKICQISQQYNVDDDDGKFKVKPQRAFRDEGEQKAYDLVARNIRNAINGLRKRAPKHLMAIKELEDQIGLPRLVFEKNDRFTPWIVESHLSRRTPQS